MLGSKLLLLTSCQPIPPPKKAKKPIFTILGSLSYWPPERFEHEKAKFDVRADIWSIGITLIELVTGSVPYKDKRGNIPNNIILLQNLIVNLNTNKTVEEAFIGYTEGTKDFVKSCLKKVEKRPKYDDLMATQFYQSCEKMELKKIVQILLKKHFYQVNTEKYIWHIKTILNIKQKSKYSKNFPVTKCFSKIIV